MLAARRAHAQPQAVDRGHLDWGARLDRLLGLGRPVLSVYQDAARERLAPAGSVLIHGEYWSAQTDETADETIEAGAPVEVTAVDGLRLRVRAARRRP